MPAVPPDERAPEAPNLEAPSLVERVRATIGSDRFDLIRIVTVVTLVGIAIGAVQLLAERPTAGASRVGSRDPASTPASTRTPVARRGPTNPGEPTFRAVHPVPGPTELRGRGPTPAAEPECPGTGQRVCMFALGEAPTVDVESLAAYFRQTYGLPITVLPTVSLQGLEEYEGRIVNQQRGQIKGDQMLEVLKARFPVSAADGRVTMIAVTPHDIYREFDDTPYLYAVRGGTRPARFTIVSNARMDDRG